MLSNTHTGGCRTNWQNQTQAEYTSAVRILANTLNMWKSLKKSSARETFSHHCERKDYTHRPPIYVLMSQTTWRPDSSNSLNSNSEKHLSMYLTLSAHTSQFLFIKNSHIHIKVIEDWILWHLNRVTRLILLSLLQFVAALQLRRALGAWAVESRRFLLLTYNFAIPCQKSPFINLLCGSKYKYSQLVHHLSP